MNARQNLSRTKEVLGAYLRQGAHELGNALFGHSTAAAPTELGMPFTRTPGEIADGLRGKSEPSPSRDDPAPSVLESHLQAARERIAAEPDRSYRDREAPEPERD